jgi:hypothetical protein
MSNPIKNSIYKILIGTFYNQHAIVLGIVYMVMFGAVRGDLLIDYHISLIQGTINSYAAMALVFSIWLIYYVRVQYFLGQQLQNKQHHYLQQITLLPTSIFITHLIRIIFICLLPVSSYAMAIVVWSFGHYFFIKGLLVLVFMLLLHILGSYYLYKRLHNLEYKISSFSFFKINVSLPKKYPLQFYIKYIFTQQKLQWLVLKIITFFTIQLQFFSATPDEELRFAIFFYGMVFVIHTNIIRQFIIWENTQLWHIRHLPITLIKKYINYFLLFVVIVSPEIYLLIKVTPAHLNVHNAVSIILLSVAAMQYLFSICIAFDNVTQNYAPLIGLFLLLTFIACLADSVLIYAIILMATSFIIYVFTQSKFELSNSNKVDSYN